VIELVLRWPAAMTRTSKLDVPFRFLATECSQTDVRVSFLRSRLDLFASLGQKYRGPKCVALTFAPALLLSRWLFTNSLTSFGRFGSWTGGSGPTKYISQQLRRRSVLWFKTGSRPLHWQKRATVTGLLRNSGEIFLICVLSFLDGRTPKTPLGESLISFVLGNRDHL